MLGVCLRDMKLIFILSSWEGLTFDSIVVWDAIVKLNGLKVLIDKIFINYFNNYHQINKLVRCLLIVKLLLLCGCELH